MSGTLSTRWFWSDWMSDPGLRACGYAARGLWKDLLCIAGSNKREYGFISLNGRKLSDAAIAQMTNGSLAEVVPLLAELEHNGVFSRDRRGVIYCRRMVRAEKNRTNGRLGGNPNLLKDKDKQNPVKPSPKALIPEPEPKPIPKKGKRRADAPLLPLPEDWQPSLADLDYASRHGFDRRQAAQLAEAFADHHRSHGKKMAKWDAAWRNWVRNEIKFSQQRRRGGGSTNGLAALALDLNFGKQEER